MITDSGISPQSSVNDWSDDGERRGLALVLAAEDFSWTDSSEVEVDCDRDKEGIAVAVALSCWAVSNDAGMLMVPS